MEGEESGRSPELAPTDAPRAGPSLLDTLLARHAPREGRSQLTEHGIAALLDKGSTEVDATVIVGDLRLSGFVLKEAVKPALFAKFIIGFTEAVRSLTNENDGWFDKFTGDGFISFWIHEPSQPREVTRIPEFCQAILPASEALVANLRGNSRNFPLGVGLSLGADSGLCELVRVGESLTLIGAPIVGASRMVERASANRMVANNLFGEALDRERLQLEARGIRIKRTNVKTKEYPGGQEAFELLFSVKQREPSGTPGTTR
jgi:class 3 adenylate cyclase